MTAGSRQDDGTAAGQRRIDQASYDNAGSLISSSSGAIGGGGTGVPSKTLAQGKGWRLDVENPSPGGRDGQIHIQNFKKGKGAIKWQYDFETGTFPDAPKKVMKELEKDPKFLQGVKKGLRYLGEE